MPEITPASQRIADYFKAVQAGETPLSVDGYSGFQAGREAAATVNETLSIGRGGSFFALDNGLLKKSDVEHVPVIKAEVNSAGNLDVTVPDKLDSAGAWLGCCDATAYNKGIIKGSGSSPLLPGGYLEVHQNGQDHFYRYTQERVDSGRLRREPSRPHLENLINQSGSKQGQETAVIIVNGVTEEGVWIADEPKREKITIVKKGRLVTINGKRVIGNHGQFMVGKHAMHLAVDGDAVHLCNDAVWQAREAAQGGEKWNVEPSSLFKEWLQQIKIKDKKDAFSVLARVLSDFGPVGWILGAGMMGLNLLAVAKKERKTYKEIRNKLKSAVENMGLQSSMPVIDGEEKFDIPKEIADEINQVWVVKPLLLSLYAAGIYSAQTSYGRLALGATKTELTGKERILAAGIGGLAVPALMLLGEAAPAKTVPLVGRIAGVILTRSFLQFVLPTFLPVLAKRVFFGKEKNISQERVAQAKEWLGLTMGAVSASITAMSALGFISDVGAGKEQVVQAGEMVNQGFSELMSVVAVLVPKLQSMIPKTEVITPPPPVNPSVAPPVQPSKTAQPEITPSVIPPPTQTQTAEPTEIPPTATEVPPTVIPPTETPVLPPTPFGGWLAGQEITKDLLKGVAEQNYGWGVDANGDGKADFQAFWLDDKQGPDLVRDITNGYQYIRNGNDYCWDNNKDGSLSQNEINYGPFSLSGIDDSGNLEKFENTNYQDVPNLSGEEIIDISSGDIASSGKAPGHAMPAPTDALPAGGPIPDKINWDSDRAYEWLKDDKGWFADNDGDGSFNPKYDSRVVGTPDIFWDDASSRWQMNHVVFMDGGNISEWQREDGVRVWNPGTNAYEYQDGVLVGYVNDNRLRVDNGLESSGADRAQRALHDENPGFSPWKIGAMYVRGEVSVPVPEAPVAVEELLLRAEAPTPPPAGEWSDGDGAKASGDWLHNEPASGGVTGVVQEKLHDKFNYLTPEQVTRAAHRLIAENQGVAAFVQLVGNGQAVRQAMDDPVNDPIIQDQVNVVEAETWLETNSNWLWNQYQNGVIAHTGLSVGDRHEIAKLAALQWESWDDDDAKEAGLLEIIKQWEEEKAENG